MVLFSPTGQENIHNFFVRLFLCCSGGKEKEENTSGRLGSSLGVIPGRLHSKGGTAAKSSRFEEEAQGCPLKTCSAFSVPARLRSQMPSAFFLFFLSKLFLVPVTLKIPSAILCRRDSSLIVDHARSQNDLHYLSVRPPSFSIAPHFR